MRLALVILFAIALRPAFGAERPAMSFDGTNDLVNVGVTTTNTISFWAQESGVWHHYANVNGTKYRDGASYSWTNSFYRFTGSALEIGYNGSSWYSEDLTDFRIFDRALSADEIQNLYRMHNGSLTQATEVIRPVGTAWVPESDNLVSWWRPGLTGSTNDYVGTNNATLNGSATATEGSGFNYNGASTTFVSVADSDTLTPTTNFSMFAWVKLTDTADTRPSAIYGHGDSDAAYNTRSIAMFYAVPNKLAVMITSNGVGSASTAKYYLTTNGFFTFNTYHHVGFTFDIPSQSLKLYANGLEVTQIQKAWDGVVSNIYNSPQSVLIGGYEFNAQAPYPDDNWQGQIDELMLIDGTALSAQNVWHLYTTTARKYKTGGVPNDPYYGDEWVDNGTNKSSLVYASRLDAPVGAALTNVYDWSRNANTGTASGGVTTVTSPLGSYRESDRSSYEPRQ